MDIGYDKNVSLYNVCFSDDECSMFTNPEVEIKMSRSFSILHYVTVAYLHSQLPELLRLGKLGARMEWRFADRP